MSVVRLHTHTHTHKYDKSGQNKRRQLETDAVVQKRLSRFPGLRNNLVSTFSNPDLQGQTVPLTGPLGPSSWPEGQEEREGDDSRQDDQGTAGVGGFSLSFFPASSTVSPSLEMTLLTVFFLGSLHAPECAEVVWQCPRGGQSSSQTPGLRTCACLQRGVGGPQLGGAFSPSSAQPRARRLASPWGAGPEGCGVSGRETQSLLARVPSVPNVLGSWEGLKASSMKSNGLCHAERWENRPLGSVW